MPKRDQASRGGCEPGVSAGTEWAEELQAERPVGADLWSGVSGGPG
ncbi:MAG TPA: hypothetical protein G4O02_18880 [Caldilineae bacterium]|nr:hypothetical protein [Caldilineae bacterium]